MIGWNEECRHLTKAVFPQITISGKTICICVFIDPEARHPLVLGTSALNDLPIQLVSEVTGEIYLPKTVHFAKTTTDQETQTIPETNSPNVSPLQYPITKNALYGHPPHYE